MSDNHCYASDKTSQHPEGMSSIKYSPQKKVLRCRDTLPLSREAGLASISQWRLEDSIAS